MIEPADPATDGAGIVHILEEKPFDVERVESVARESTSGPRARSWWRADGMMFWLLTGLGFALLVPCVLVPEWAAYERAAVAEQYQRHRVDRLRAAVDRERRLLEAVRSDPAVVARLAQRDLGLYRKDERAVLVGVGVMDEETADEFVPQPVRPPALVERVVGSWPADYSEVFCDEGTRGTVMALSTGLMVVAFALFGRKKG